MNLLIKKNDKKVLPNIADGWINLRKKESISSFKVIEKIRKHFSLKKVGHLGTLDPQASGVLPVALGQATKTINFITNKEKIYSFTIRWGEETETDDAEGDVTKTSQFRPSEIQIENTIEKSFLGYINQKPPKYSAVKINGRRAYDLAREKKSFTTNFKKVKIYNFKILSNVDENHTSFKVKCNSGTYIRSLARDLARKLGTYGHALNIKREQDNFFKIANSIELDTILKCNIVSFNKNILPLEFVLQDFMKIELEKTYLADLKNGKKIYLDYMKDMPHVKNNSILVKYNGKLVSIANLEKGYIIPRRNFNNQFWR